MTDRLSQEQLAALGAGLGATVVSNGAVVHSSVSANGDSSHIPPIDPKLTEEALDVLEVVDFVTAPGDAAALACAANLSCTPWDSPSLKGFVRDRQIVVVGRDDDRGAAEAREIASRCLEYRAASVQIWTIPEYGSVYATMKAWCSNRNILALLGVVQAGQWRDFAVFAGDPKRYMPEFAEEPRPITVDLLPIPGLDPRMIPRPLRDWLKDIADRGWFPPEYGTAAALVGLSGLVGRKVAIRPKRHDDWLVVPNLWGAVVGPPGIQKTPAVEEALRPLRRLAADAIEHHKQAVADREALNLVAAAKKDAAKRALAKAAKDGSTDSELATLAKAAAIDEDDGKPVERRYLVNDTTVEKLGELLPRNPNGLTLFRDELTGFLRTMDRQGHESDRGFYLEAWNGFNTYTFDRIGRGTIHIPNVCLALFGTIQPGPLARYLRGSISGEEEDGFIPRFQILMYPDSPDKFINVDRYPDTTAKAEAYSVFKALDALDPVAMGCTVDSERGIPYIGFSEEAQAFFDGWRIELENRLRSATLSNLMTNHLAKYRSLMPALALLFHLIDSHAAGRLDPVSLDAAELAAAWCELLEHHANRIYQSAMDGDPGDAMKLAEKIKDSVANPFTYRDVAKKGWTGLTTSEDVRRAVDLLDDRGWVKVVEVPPGDRGGHPSKQVWIHPKLIGEGVHP